MNSKIKILIFGLFVCFLVVLTSYLYLNHSNNQVISTLEKPDQPLKNPLLPDLQERIKPDIAKQGKKIEIDEKSPLQQKSASPKKHLLKGIKKTGDTDHLFQNKIFPSQEALIANPSSSGEEREIYTVVAPYVALDGYEIMKKTLKIKRPRDESTTVTFRLIFKEKDEKSIVTKRYWKQFDEKDDIQSKTLILVDDAGSAEFRWTVLMMTAFVVNPEDEISWILPSLRKKEPEITHAKDGNFLGSDFTIEDLSDQKLGEGEHHFLRQEDCRSGGREKCYLVETIFKKGPYSKQIRWIKEQDFTTTKIEHYDQKGNLFKTQYIDWQTIDDYKVWLSSEMVNNQNMHKTKYDISFLKINSNLKDSLFDIKSYTTKGNWKNLP
ncbi:MAG: outer membrane lipoprotein-sorting protein [Nitrospirae bacterium]|nr:outer membrane lipoprotein-sorting protein [Nitrospirota bacterium]